MQMLKRYKSQPNDDAFWPSDAFLERNQISAWFWPQKTIDTSLD